MMPDTQNLSNPSDNTAPVYADADLPDPLEASTALPGTLLKLPRSDQDLLNSEWREQAEKILRFLILFPDYFNETFGEYRKPLTTIGIVLAAGLGIAVADGVLTRLNTIPLFAPTFELIGLGFTGWFVVRYLLYADTRRELLEDYSEIKQRIVGKDD
ncbi:MAG: CAAD domain-containing protein [Thermosynechococcaceae cyanobacterium]